MYGQLVFEQAFSGEEFRPQYRHAALTALSSLTDV